VTPRHVKDLRRCREVWLALDNDDAGDAALHVLISGLDDHVELYIVPPPPGHKDDLGDVDDDALAELLESRVSAFELQLDL
jgi:DNA primase